MHRHEPPGYRCPFCDVLAGRESERNALTDIVLGDLHATALISPKWWEGNLGHVLVVPNEHFENLYDIPVDRLGSVYALVQKIALALRAAYACDGTSTRQHNEPGGGQDVWHFHVHVFPRYAGDRFYERHRETRWATPEERLIYAVRLRAALGASTK